MPPKERDESEPLSAMTMNVGNGRARASDLLPVLRASEADLIALQEVSRAQALELERELAAEYPFRVVHGAGVEGKALLSKLPILEHEFLRFHSRRAYLRVRLEAGGRALHALVVHVPVAQVLLGPFGVAAGDLAGLSELAVNLGSCLVLGDFNLTPRIVGRVCFSRAGLCDAFGHAGSGPGWTFPIFLRYRRLPLPSLVRIDHIWHTGDLKTLAAWVGPDAGSDHRPVLARFAWNEADEA